MSSLLIIDIFLWSVVVDWLPKRCRTPGLTGDEFSRPDHIFAGLAQISHTAMSAHTGRNM